jgi:hypothetical protein
MNRNSFLFAALILFVVGTYFIQEKRVESERIETDREQTLVSEEIIHLKLPHIEAIKKNGEWRDDENLLSHNIFQQIEKKLKEIKKIKEVSGRWENYFSKPISIEVNREIWTFGQLSLDRQAFYVGRGKDIFLAQIVGESRELTTNAEDIASTKLKELLTLISKDRPELLENQLFRFYPDLPMEKATLVLDGHLPFELNFVTNTTSPPPIQGVSVHKDLKKKFHSLLTQVTIKEEVSYKKNRIFKKLGQITFSNQQKTVDWELWLKSKKSADVILVDPSKKKAYQMYGGTLKIFFISIQEYWDKKVIPDSYFLSFESLPIKFSQGSRTANVVVINREPLDYTTSSKFKIDNPKMEQLIQIVLNLGLREQSDRVSLLSKSERKQLLSEDHLRLEVMGQELIVWRKPSELIVANVTQGFKAHFFITDENFRGSFEDVLK